MWIHTEDVFGTENDGSIFLQNVGVYLQVHKAVQPWRSTSAYPLLWNLMPHTEDLYFIKNPKFWYIEKKWVIKQMKVEGRHWSSKTRFYDLNLSNYHAYLISLLVK
jgi:hypothetical protein